MTGAKHNGFAWPLPWNEYLRLLRDGTPDTLLPYSPDTTSPSADQMLRAAEDARAEMVFSS
ncbi:MAG: hypothetical protein SOI66_05190 [Bifidobacterium sp.]